MAKRAVQYVNNGDQSQHRNNAWTLTAIDHNTLNAPVCRSLSLRRRLANGVKKLTEQPLEMKMHLWPGTESVLILMHIAHNAQCCSARAGRRAWCELIGWKLQQEVEKHKSANVCRPRWTCAAFLKPCVGTRVHLVRVSVMRITLFMSRFLSTECSSTCCAKINIKTKA